MSLISHHPFFHLQADDHELCYNLAVLLGDKGDTAQEVLMLRKAIAAKPDFGRAWANLGVALASGGDIEGAEEPFRETALLDPSSWRRQELAAYGVRWPRACARRASEL